MDANYIITISNNKLEIEKLPDISWVEVLEQVISELSANDR